MIFKFGSFTLDSAARQLRRGADPIHLSPKALDLLTALVMRRPDAVPKDDIHKILWPDAFVADVNLAVLIAEIRSVLNDDARTPSFIRTVTRYGYAFSGEAIELGRPSAPRDALPCWLAWGVERAPLKNGENLVGRDSAADVRIDAVGVSRRHALIHVRVDGATVQDLSSKNGTFVGDVRVAAPIDLVDGSEIRFGPLPVRFHRPDAALSTQTLTRASRHQRRSS